MPVNSSELRWTPQKVADPINVKRTVSLSIQHGLAMSVKPNLYITSESKQEMEKGLRKQNLPENWYLFPVMFFSCRHPY